MADDRRFLAVGIAFGLLLGFGPATARAQAPAPQAGVAVFNEQVREVLTGKCLACHAGDKTKGGLDLTRRESALKGGKAGAAVVPGAPDDSLLLEKLEAGEMPPKNPLTKEQIAAFRAWIEAGASYSGETLSARRAGPDWWSLRPIQRPEPPPVGDSKWVRSPIDAFILAALRERRLEPSPEADRRTLIRRASFDLIGLPPTPEEVAAFVDDPDPRAYETLIDRLLESPRYGERWGRHWLDVARFGESEGYETNLPRPNAWRYRDYVIRAFNRDAPLPRFALEQLAGDSIAGADATTQAATGFLVGGTHDVVGNATIEGQLQQRADDLDNIITVTGAAFLGLTVNCARCHDHKFDPVTQKDYYALQAIFAGVQHAEREVPTLVTEDRKREAAAVQVELADVDRRIDDQEPAARPDLGRPGRSPVNFARNVERFAPVAARFVRFTVQSTNNGIEPCIDELEIFSAGPSPRNVALASAGAKASASSEYPNADIHKIVHLNDGRFGNGRSWISAAPGKGWAQVELAQVETIDRVVWGRDFDRKFKDRLATEYYIEVAKEPGEWRVVASSADRQPWAAVADKPESPAAPLKALLQKQGELRKRLGELTSGEKIYAGTFTKPGPTRLLKRGDPMQPGEEVAPAPPAVVGPKLALPPNASEQDRRVALARWLGDPANPLPARVMVNRVWHHHFGRGIVATPGDLGFNGGRPSHPALLDWLAAEYVGQGFKLKPIHRAIMLSAVYRQSSRAVEKALKVDHDNVHLWRASPRRLEAEPIRDSILSASGQLDLRPGGPGYDLWEPNSNYVHVYIKKAKLGPAESRRMVYQFRPRSGQDPTFGAFDCPESALVTPRRTTSITPLQALNLLNSEFLIDQADKFADRLVREAGPDLAKQAERGFQIAFGRAPSAAEHKEAAALIRKHGAAAFCRALFNANEFVYVQ